MRIIPTLARLARFRLALIAFGLLAALLLCAAGCSGAGDLAIASQNRPDTTLASGFSSGVYRFDSRDELTVVLFDGPIDKPTQVCTIRLFWRPHAGRTPIDQTATNATVHYIIFAGDKRDRVGVYSGAGFVHLKSDPGADTLRGAVWESNLRLTDRNDGFKDLLGPSLLEGKFSARRDDGAVSRALQGVNAQLRDQLAYPRMVHANPPQLLASSDSK